MFQERFLFCALLLFIPSAYCLAHFSAVPTAVSAALTRPLHLHFANSSTVGLKFTAKRFEECDSDCSLRKLLRRKGSKAGSSRFALSIEFDVSSHYCVYCGQVQSGPKASKAKLCSWNSRNAQCVVRDTVTAHYLRRTQDPFANYAAHFAVRP